MEILTDYDITVIGCGPGGASAAYFSKIFDNENSKKVLAIDSLEGEDFRRYHRICGEAVSCLLEDDFPGIDISQFSKNKINNITEYWGNEVKISSRFSGYILDRPEFLENIIRKYKRLGGKHRNDTLVDIENKGESIKVRMESDNVFETEYLVLATGPSRCVENFSLNVKDRGSKTVLCQLLLDKKPEETNSLEFYYDEDYGENYKWIFPYGDKTKIGVPFANRDELSKYSKKNIIRKDTKPVAPGLLESYNIGNIVFVGDSAYQNNPLTKGGIRPAVNAGRMAAESLVRYEDPSRYDSLWKESGFFNEPYLNASETLRDMDNKELARHSKPLKYYPLSIPVLLLKYRKYRPLYDAYSLSEKYGW